MKGGPVRVLSDFLGELKRRGVYPALAAYAVISWILLQIGEVTFDPLGLPQMAMRGLIVLVALGFPVVIVLSWIFEITPGGIRRDRSSGVFSRLARDRSSIAVLPFVDMSSERDQGYFCEGIAEEILNALTRLEQLRVMSRTSSFRYGGSDRGARQIGEELGVETLLTGSVRKADNRLRVTAELVDVPSGSHLWSERFDREREDVFDIQDEIARQIAQLLLDTITPQQESAIKTTEADDVEAYEYYLRGKHFANRLRKTEQEFAIQMFRQAIELDPGFAAAWAGYADSHSLLCMYSDPEETHRAEADSASRKALELAPGLAEAHASCGLACLVQEQFEEAEEHFRQAQRMNPQLFEAFYYHARTKFHRGELAAAAELFGRAADVNPSDYQSRCLRVQILRGLDQLDLARQEARSSVAVIENHLKWNPDDVRALHLGAGSLIVDGQSERAKDWLRRALEIAPDDSVLLYNLACNFATLGEAEEALDYLERAADAGMVSVDWMRNDLDLVDLRSHPRYEALVQKLEALAPPAQHSA